MKRAFLERPNDWLRTQRTAADVVRDAYAIQELAKAKNRSFEVASAIVIIIGAAGLYFWR